MLCPILQIIPDAPVYMGHISVILLDQLGKILHNKKNIGYVCNKGNISYVHEHQLLCRRESLRSILSLGKQTRMGTATTWTRVFLWGESGINGSKTSVVRAQLKEVKLQLF